MIQSCDPVLEASTKTIEAEVFISEYYLSGASCSMPVNQVDEYDVYVTISVDGLVGGGIELIDYQILAATNDDSDPDNLQFTIDVPKKGSFFVDVRVAIECSQCCALLSPGVRCQSSFWGEGHQRDFIAFVNVRNVREIYAFPEFLGCFNCGC